MVQRVVRQLKESGIRCDITVATSESQRDSVFTQLGPDVSIVTEPTRRDTFPAICLASEYLYREKHCDLDEVTIVMPCDPYTEAGYFDVVAAMASAVERNAAELMVMGIVPTYPSSKYGYVVPGELRNGIVSVKRFTEKPDVDTARHLIDDEGAFWNGGVFAFRLGYIIDISSRYNRHETFADIRSHYSDYPKISFDYEVAEKAASLGMEPFSGSWKDLGTWNTLTDELETSTFGNVTVDGSGVNTHVFNELDIPLMCIGTHDLVIAASPDGILVSEKSRSEDIKALASALKHRPMYEERRWGKYWVIDHSEFPDGFRSLTKRLTLNPGASISYQRHSLRNEVWTFLDGEGEVVVGTERRPVGRGSIVEIPAGVKHTLRANTSLTFIEVQSGSELVEEDIERFDYQW